MTAMRIFLLLMSALVSLGIYLTGYQSVHLIIYLPAIGLAFAGITGTCPSIMLLKKLGFK